MGAWVMIIVLASGMGGGGTSIGRAAAIGSISFATQEACAAALPELPTEVRRHGSAVCVKTGAP